jgi:hypothetical protein
MSDKLREHPLLKFYNPKVVNAILYMMGIDTYGDSAGRIKSVVNVGNALNPDLQSFSVSHELLHTALLTYLTYLFEEVLPSDFLTFEWMDEGGGRTAYKIPVGLVSQSTLVAEMIVLSLDTCFRVVDVSAVNPNFDFYGPFLLAQAPMETKLPKITSKVAFNSQDSFSYIVCKLAAAAILTTTGEEGDQWAFGNLRGLTAAMVETAKNLHCHLDSPIDQEPFASNEAWKFNKQQIASLINRMGYLLYVLFDRGYENGREMLPESFTGWLHSTTVRLYQIDGLSEQAIIDYFRQIIHSNVSDKTYVYNRLDSMNSL